MSDAAELLKTPLHDLHVELGGRMVGFAGYSMPVQYAEGVLAEHNWTRQHAGLFDVSHMGQAFLMGSKGKMGSDDAHVAVAASMETLVPGEIQKLKKGGLRYSVLLADDGGVLDDLMITRPAHDKMQGSLFLVVNAARKDHDFAFITEKLAGVADVRVAPELALLALQGPKAAGVLAGVVPESAEQTFMTMRSYEWEGVSLTVSRCGYTGEDGFEISLPDTHAEKLARVLLAHDDVKPIGLGARDSLRLEAGLCLYGSDMTSANSPIDANIGFVIGKRRREVGGFPGATRILRERGEGTSRLRIGLRPHGKAPARAHTEIQSADGDIIGEVTSGGFGPTVGGPVAMGYVDAAHAATGTTVHLMVRGKALAADVVDMPFVPHRYHRG